MVDELKRCIYCNKPLGKANETSLCKECWMENYKAKGKVKRRHNKIKMEKLYYKERLKDASVNNCLGTDKFNPTKQKCKNCHLFMECEMQFKKWHVVIKK